MEKAKKHRAIEKAVTIKGFLKATLYSNGIIEILWDSSIETIEIIHLKKMWQTVAELGDGQKMPLLFTAQDFLHVSNEGKKYAVSDECIQYTLAIVVMVDNLAKRLVYNAFMKFNKPRVTTKSFSNKESAFNWLEKAKNSFQEKLAAQAV